MTKFKSLLLAGAVIAALTTLALGQSIVPKALSGNESWQAGQGPGGPSIGYVTSNLIRGGTQDITGTVTGNITLNTNLAFGGNFLVTAQPSAATITMPPSPIPDGAIVGVCNVTGSAWATNTVTLAANSNQTIAQTATLTTLAAGTCAREQWNQSAATWYRVQ